MREETGSIDKTGRPILEGDIVEFFFDAVHGYAEDASAGHTRMVDTVEKIDGHWYFIDPDIRSGAFVWRHAAHAKVIGNIHDAPVMEEAVI